MTLVDGESAMERVLNRAVDAGGGSPGLRTRRAGQKDKGLSKMESAERPSSCPPGRAMHRPRRFRSGWTPGSLPFAPCRAQHNSLATDPDVTAPPSGRGDVEGAKRDGRRGRLLDNDGTFELHVAHGQNNRGRLFEFDGRRFVHLANDRGSDPPDWIGRGISSISITAPGRISGSPGPNRPGCSPCGTASAGGSAICTQA